MKGSPGASWWQPVLGNKPGQALPVGPLTIYGLCPTSRRCCGWLHVQSCWCHNITLVALKKK